MKSSSKGKSGPASGGSCDGPVESVGLAELRGRVVVGEAGGFGVGALGRAVATAGSAEGAIATAGSAEGAVVSAGSAAGTFEIAGSAIAADGITMLGGVEARASARSAR
jgi:hypothetical protein